MSDARFRSRLNYSSVNEDWRAEATCLRPRPGSRVLCLTGSGARPLDLLAEVPLRVVSIDFAPAQNHLLRLKAAALASLPFDEYARFLGLHDCPGPERSRMYGRIRGGLDDSARAWWDGHGDMLERGVLYEGAFERHMRCFSRVIRWLRPKARRTLLNAQRLSEQADFARTTWDRAWWRAFLRVSLSPVASHLVLGDPAYYRRPAVPPGPTVHARMLLALQTWLARSNFMVGLILTGRLPAGDLPPHLTEAGVRRIRSRLAGLEVVDAELLEYLRREPTCFDGFSLSDVPSYLEAEDMPRLIELVARRATPGARVVIRQFLTRDPWPEGTATRLTRLPHAERRARRLDRSFAYEFFVAEALP